MRRVIGFLGSLGVGVMLSAAGLVFDAQTLFYAGLAIVALMLALWLWAWAQVTPVAITNELVEALLDTALPPHQLDPQHKALFLLRRARENADVARSKKGELGKQLSRRAFHDLEGAMVMVDNQFGIKPLNFHKAAGIPHPNRMTAYISFVDLILPLLSDGRVTEAHEKAKAFTWRWGTD